MPLSKEAGLPAEAPREGTAKVKDFLKDGISDYLTS
jgi:hypothetical protein